MNPKAMGLNLSNGNRSNIEYLNLFLYTVESYRRITDRLPVVWSKDHYKINMTEENAAINVRALLLRKYITNHDNVYLPTVIEKAKIVLPEQEAELAIIYKEYFDAHDREIKQTLEDGTELNLRQAFEDLIYGLFLHADFERSNRLIRSSEQMRFYCIRNFVHLIELSVFKLSDFLLKNNLKASYENNLYQKAPVIAILERGEKSSKEITGYWSNLYGKDIKINEITDDFYKSRNLEEMQIMQCAISFLSKLEGAKITQDDMKDVLFRQTLRDWGDFIEAKRYLASIKDYGIATTVNFNNRKDVAYVKVLENVENVFVVSEKQIIPVHCITLIRDEDLGEWRVFAFGSAIDPYIDR